MDLRLYNLCNGRFNVNRQELLIGVLRRGEDQLLGICDEDNFFGVFIFLPWSSDQSVGDDGYNPEHPQENTDTASLKSKKEGEITGEPMEL